MNVSLAIPSQWSYPSLRSACNVSDQIRSKKMVFLPVCLLSSLQHVWNAYYLKGTFRVVRLNNRVQIYSACPRSQGG